MVGKVSSHIDEWRFILYIWRRRGDVTRATREVEKSISQSVMSPVLVEWHFENGSVV